MGDNRTVLSRSDIRTLLSRSGTRGGEPVSGEGRGGVWTRPLRHLPADLPVYLRGGLLPTLRRGPAPRGPQGQLRWDGFVQGLRLYPYCLYCHLYKICLRLYRCSLCCHLIKVCAAIPFFYLLYHHLHPVEKECIEIILLQNIYEEMITVDFLVFH